MTLHSELNNARKNKSEAFKEIIHNDKNSMLEFYIKEFSLNNISIISDLFFATKCRVTQCSNCNMQMFNFQTYFYLIFPLEEIIHFKKDINSQNSFSNNIINNIQSQFYNYMNNIQNLYISNIQNSCSALNINGNQFNDLMMNQNNEFNNYLLNQQKYYNNIIINIQNLCNNNNNNRINNDEINIIDCFEYYRKINYMTGDDAMYCKNCKTTTNFCKRTDLTTGPEVLFIILNQSKQVNCNIKLNFSEYLDLSNYFELKNLGCFYRLNGVIISFLESEKQNIVAFCRDPIIGKWNKYHDEIVSEVKDFQKEVINIKV